MERTKKTICAYSTVNVDPYVIPTPMLRTMARQRKRTKNNNIWNCTYLRKLMLFLPAKALMSSPESFPLTLKNARNVHRSNVAAPSKNAMRETW